MRRWLRSSLRRKLSLLVAGSVVIPLVALGLFAFVTSSRITEEKATLSGIDMLKQLDANLRFMLVDIENISIYLIGERDIQSYLLRHEDREDERTEIVGRMTNLATSKPYIANISIYPERFDAQLSTGNWYESDLPNPGLAKERKPGKFWSDVYRIVNYSGEQHVITLMRPIRSIHDYAHLGWMSISLSERVLSRSLIRPDFGRGEGRIELVNADGIILSSADKSRLGKRLDEYDPGLFSIVSQAESGSAVYGEDEGKRTVLYYREGLTDWILIGTIPYDQYRAENGYILGLTGIAVGISAAVSVLLVWFTVRRTTRPLQLLARHLTRINPHRPLPHFAVTTDDEIGKLGESYNLLGAHIEELKQDVIRGEARKKEADMRALQAQINPHFLYNTLSSIHWIALMAKEARIADMVEGLSQFLRLSLNQGKEYCPVEQEVDHIRQYARVQNIRYSGKFRVDYMVDASLKDQMMLKLLLQPLVENAMIHGLQKKDGPGTILIMIRPEGRMMSFLILDDGVGMSRERLEEVRRSLHEPLDNDLDQEGAAEEGGYGLRNVNERLMLHYGPDAQLEVDSREGGGTRIAFTIPMLEGAP
ncbi:sensor histidine kinase [Paenibacillus cisolokensis]|uniref:sensor histidine kinase n=1 Tax=Paenibacillus cisolokensis TaxID=1658519 RepID=UPI003D2B3588